jgi:hypothetical protein
MKILSFLYEQLLIFKHLDAYTLTYWLIEHGTLMDTFNCANKENKEFIADVFK